MIQHLPKTLLILAVLTLTLPSTTLASVACETNTECQALLGAESICNPTTKICSNPFESGCLYQRLPGWNQKRVCNSEDSPETIDAGLCVPPPFEYPEVRISSGNWESITFNAWLLQILYNEILGVPATLEPGNREAAVVNFYDPTGGWAWGTSKATESLENAHRFEGDCQKAKRDGDDYEPCMHITPEFWLEGPWVRENVANGVIEPPEFLGVLAQETLFVPRFTAERDPSLLSYIGMQGEKNRQKLADAFLRPTLWSDYCNEVSNTSCSSPDGVAQRAPEDEDEGDTYWSDGLYTGHFRKTPESYDNVTHNATGHLIDYPCDWTSYAEQQLYHLDIALSGDRHTEGSRGYKSKYFEQVLAAANATKSNIIIMWALPDPYYQMLIGTDMELHPVLMPPITQECLSHKRPWDDSCAADWGTRVGDPRGACENPPSSLRKGISTILTRDANDPSVSDAARSPALSAIQQFKVTAPIYGSWFDLLIERDALNEARRSLMRDATCTWVVENIDIVQQWVPFSYPRVIKDGKENSALVIASSVLGSMAVLLVLAAAALVHRSQQRRVMKFAQVAFLNFLLAGLLLMSIGALLVAIPPTNGSCIASLWFINVGYTIELAPLLVKVAAINRLLSASERMQKVTIDRKSLFRSVLAITTVIVVFLIVWSAVDPPCKEGELSLSTNMSDRNETMVYQTYYCSSESDVWQYVAFGWTYALLLRSTVLAFEMRNVRQEFNESQTLAMMTYSHFVFSILRLAVYLLDDLRASDRASYSSILLSVDAMATLIIYFLPKFITLRSPDPRGSSALAPSQSLNSTPFRNSTDGSKSATSGKPEATIPEEVAPVSPFPLESKSFAEEDSEAQVSE